MPKGFLAEDVADSALAKAEAWLEQQEQVADLPLYLSVDIRDAGFKALPVDANLFPAGFNNLHPQDHTFISFVLREALKARLSHQVRRVLIIMEEHSRNLWYLENIVVLQNLLLSAGIAADVTTPLELENLTYKEGQAILYSASGKPLVVKQLSLCKKDNYDIAILNNDLINGIPDSLKDLPFPICPSPRLGWHSRLKSSHFDYYNRMAGELAQILGIEPWQLTALSRRVADVDINLDSEREILAENAAILLEEIARNYRARGISTKPFAFLKADYGTYGMGVISFESPQEIRFMNRKTRNRLFKGKGGREIHAYLLQEGVPNTLKYNGYAAEVCVYQIDRYPVGQFLRYNTQKTERDNLNSTGMQFFSFSALQSPLSFKSLRLYYILSRVAMLAAAQELQVNCEKYELSFSY